MMRKDVMKLAEKLHEASGINADHIYLWLMDLGRAKSVNPLPVVLYGICWCSRP